MIVSGVDLPDLLQVKSEKPWDYPHFELMNLWKFGDHKSFVPLGLLCGQLGVDYNMILSVKEIDLVEKYLQNDINGSIGVFRRFF